MSAPKAGVALRPHTGRVTKKELRTQRRRLKAIQQTEDEVAQQLAAEGVEIVRSGNTGGHMTLQSPQQKSNIARKERSKRRSNKRSRAYRLRMLSAPTRKKSVSEDNQSS